MHGTSVLIDLTVPKVKCLTADPAMGRRCGLHLYLLREEFACTRDRRPSGYGGRLCTGIIPWESLWSSHTHLAREPQAVGACAAEVRISRLRQVTAERAHKPLLLPVRHHRSRFAILHAVRTSNVASSLFFAHGHRFNSSSYSLKVSISR